MSVATDPARFRPPLMPAVRSVWIVLIITCGACLSPFMACVTPFAALATLAALKLGWSDAVASVALVWLINQAIGYGLLGYPRNLDSAEWGLAIGVSAGLAILAARALSAEGPVPFAISLPFAAAFAAFELGLYLTGFLLPGSAAGFTTPVIGHVFLINLVTLAGLLAANGATALVRLLARNDPQPPHPFGAASVR